MAEVRVQAEVLRLAASGVDLDAVAHQVGVTTSRAARVLEAALERRIRQSPGVEAERLLEVEHLNMLRRALTPAALRGDVAAARLLVRISQQRTILLGLAAEPEPEPIPEETYAAEVAPDPLDAELAQLLSGPPTGGEG